MLLSPIKATYPFLISINKAMLSEGFGVFFLCIRCSLYIRPNQLLLSTIIEGKVLPSDPQSHQIQSFYLHFI